MALDPHNEANPPQPDAPAQPLRLSVTDLLGLSLFRGFRGSGWINLLVLLGLGALFFAMTDVAHQWKAPLRPTIDIHLDLWHLPQYTLFSLARGLVAYLFSLLFTLVYAYWAAYDSRAEKVLIPALDILQSIPVLSFLPTFVLGLVAIFPHSNFGLELACVLSIFTGQVWNMTFSLYYSLKGVPEDYRYVARLTNLTRFQFLGRVELPLAANGLVFNSMMSMAGGWFFLTVAESFTLGDKDFRLPGLGSYMSVAQQQHNLPAECYAVVAMILMIVVLDQLLWRPLVVWTQRFKLEDIQSGPVDRSWFLDLLLKSSLVHRFLDFLQKPRVIRHAKPKPTEIITDTLSKKAGPGAILGYWLIVTLLLLAAAWSAYKIVMLLFHVPLGEWLHILWVTFLTSLRVFATLILATLWTVPVGVLIGSNARLQRLLQPVIQVTASFPAPMLYAILLAGIFAIGGNLEWGAVILMLMGTQWYILFNVISGAAAIPADLRACSDILALWDKERWLKFYLPAIFPSLVTGWITAAGGAWNASIVAEYINTNTPPLVATGLGSLISDASSNANYPVLAAATLVMAGVVVGINRLVWKPLQRLAEDRYRLLN